MVPSETNLAKTPPAPPPVAADLALSMNERRVLGLLRQHADLTRAELTQHIGLTAQSVSRLVDSLEGQGLLISGARVNTGGRGQPSVRLHLNRQSVFGVGLSIMTDAVSGAVMNIAGDVIAKDWLRLPATDADTIMATCQNLFAQLLTQADVQREQVIGVGAGVTGYFVGQGRHFNPPDPLDSLAFVDVDAMLSAALGLPVWIDNDGNVAAMGELIAGVGARYRSFAYLFFSMGIGGAIVIDGRLIPGNFGNAGEFGGVIPPQDHDIRPTLELLRVMMAERGRVHATIYDMLRDFDMAAPGVEEWIALTRPILTLICSSIGAVVDPAAIVLGGRLPKSLAERLTREVAFFSVPRRGVPKPFPDVVVSTVTGDAAAIGAAATPLNAVLFP